jgi:hypothetical protein
MRPTTKTETVSVTRVEVWLASAKGSGGPVEDLPPDMLRYDLAFVHASLAATVAFPRFQLRQSGTTRGTPTLGRWSSFDIQLEPATISAQRDVSESLHLHPEEWFTYRHPLQAEGTPDYTSLVKVSLAEILAQGLKGM